MVYPDNFLTYLKWRADLSFKTHPFNEIDALILTELVYIHFDGIVSGVGEEGCITIREANARYEKSKVREMLFYKKKEELFDVLAECPRFSEMTLCNFVDTYDVEAQQQFAAMHVNVSPYLTFIAFRGTDSTVIGWRENFNMSYMMPVPAQQSAVDYVNQTAKGLLKKYWIGGHSKGGNLAVYSAVHCRPIIKRKIISVYSNDGPGFSKEMVASEAYQKMLPKIRTIIPESSIVGLILEHEEEVQIVKSTNVGVGQHDAMSWEVLGNHFVYTDKVAEQSVFIDETMRTWLMELDAVQREIIVEAVFEILDELNIRTVDDFTHLKFADIQEANKLRKNLPAGTQELLSHAVKLLFKTGKNSVELYLREKLENSKLSKK